jgi:hypothetical protein
MKSSNFVRNTRTAKTPLVIFLRLRRKFRDNKPLFSQLIGYANKLRTKIWVMRVVFHPLSNVRRWRASLNHGNGKCPADLKRDAMAAWRRFVSCVAQLPTHEAASLNLRVKKIPTPLR